MRRPTHLTRFCLALALSGGLSAAAGSTELNWRPLSPSFGGDPLNTTHLYQSAQTQNVHRPKPSNIQPSEQEQFLASVRSRVYSRLAAQISDQIFGENPSERGTINLGGQRVVYERVGNEIVLSLSEGGKTTQIRFPVAAVAP